MNFMVFSTEKGPYTNGSYTPSSLSNLKNPDYLKKQNHCHHRNRNPKNPSNQMRNPQNHCNIDDEDNRSNSKPILFSLFLHHHSNKAHHPPIFYSIFFTSNIYT